MQKKSFSWGIVILLFILFFPVGIWMLVKKMTSETTNYEKNGRALKNFGCVLFCFGIVYLIMGISGQLVLKGGGSILPAMAAAIALFGGGGLFMISKGSQLIKRGKKLNKYVAIINAAQDTSIASIAAAYPTTYEIALVDLQQVLDAGYFPDCHLDVHRREFITPVSKPAPVAAGHASESTWASAGTPPAASIPEQPRIVKCANCGADNTVVPGAVTECEYCGSPLS